MNQKFESFKKYVQDHKPVIKAVATTLAITGTVIVLQQMGIKSLNDFLDTNGLKDEYYALDDSIEV